MLLSQLAITEVTMMKQAIVDDVIDYDYAPIAILVCHKGISKMVCQK